MILSSRYMEYSMNTALQQHSAIFSHGGVPSSDASFLASNRTNNSDADAALPTGEAWGDAVAIGRAADRRVVRPRAAAQYPLAVREPREAGTAV
jgi:hypothetical protein